MISINSTVRIRFRTIDVYQDIEWTTPVGKITINHEHDYSFTVYNSYYDIVYISDEYENDTELVKALNRFIQLAPADIIDRFKNKGSDK